MAEKKPTYDDIAASNQEYEIFGLAFQSMICLVGWFLYCLSLLIVFSAAYPVASSYSDIHLLLGYVFAYVFLEIYGFFHIVIGLASINEEWFEGFVDEVAVYIQRFFRVWARTSNSMNDGEKPKEAQTKLSEK